MDDTIPMPDLSHLTEDERQSIMKVMQRQQEEEKREKSMYQSGNLPSNYRPDFYISRFSRA